MQFSQKRKAREEVYRALHRGKINAKTNHHMDRSKLYVGKRDFNLQNLGIDFCKKKKKKKN